MEHAFIVEVKTRKGNRVWVSCSVIAKTLSEATEKGMRIAKEDRAFTVEHSKYCGCGCSL